MKCERCGKNEAVIKLTRIRQGSVEELHVCQVCAAEISPYQAKLAMKKQLSVDTLLKELLEQQQGAKVIAEGPGGKKIQGVEPCPTCGLDYMRYKSTLMLGCPDCYDAFGEALLADLEKMHGATQHVGTRREGAQTLMDWQARHRMLQAELQESVENEDYTRAATLRDELKKLEESMAEHSNGGGEQ